MGEISKLPEHVANQIAAGEVVQRPSSVVKELLENAVDAQATRVELRLRSGGIASVSVIDNGSGIHPSQLALAFERHATSKLKSADDLFRLATKGFRGEALASIAAVSDVVMVSKTADEPTAFAIRMRAGKQESFEETAFSTGTSVSVSHLFFTIPARKNFLKSEAVELKHCLDEFHRVALLHENIHFQCFHNEAVLYDLPVGSRHQRIVHIFGSKYADRLVPVKEQTERFELSGYVIKPEYAKKTRGEQFFFINKRFIRSPYLHKAVLEAFEGLLLSGHHPGYFIEIDIDKAAIDVNIHPTKTEIKLDDEYHVFSVLRAAVRHSLGRYQINAPINFELNPTFTPSYEQLVSEAKAPRIKVSSTFNPFKPDAQQQESFSELYVETDAQQIRIDGQTAAKEELWNLDSVKTFQWANKFIVVSSADRLLVIDQYRAHQRVLYEAFLKKMTVEHIGSQQLLFQESIALQPQEWVLFETIESHLIDLGFEFERSAESLIIKGVPEFFPPNESGSVFKRLIEEAESLSSVLSYSTADMAAKVLAKHSAVKKGVALSAEAITELITDLSRCKEPYLSPFNKRIFVTVQEAEIIQKLH